MLIITTLLCIKNIKIACKINLYYVACYNYNVHEVFLIKQHSIFYCSIRLYFVVIYITVHIKCISKLCIMDSIPNHGCTFADQEWMSVKKWAEYIRELDLCQIERHFPTRRSRVFENEWENVIINRVTINQFVMLDFGSHIMLPQRVIYLFMGHIPLQTVVVKRVEIMLQELIKPI